MGFGTGIGKVVVMRDGRDEGSSVLRRSALIDLISADMLSLRSIEVVGDSGFE